MLDTGEEDGYLIALWPLSSSKQGANASIVSVRCLLISSAFLPAPAPDASLRPMPAYLLTHPLRDLGGITTLSSSHSIVGVV